MALFIVTVCHCNDLQIQNQNMLSSRKTGRRHALLVCPLTLHKHRTPSDTAWQNPCRTQCSRELHGTRLVFCPWEHFHISPWAPQKHQDRVLPLLLSAELSWVKGAECAHLLKGHCHDTSALQKQEAPWANTSFKMIRCFVDTTESTWRCSSLREGQCQHLSLLPLHLYISPHPH